MDLELRFVDPVLLFFFLMGEPQASEGHRVNKEKFQEKDAATDVFETLRLLFWAAMTGRNKKISFDKTEKNVCGLSNLATLEEIFVV